MQKKRKNMVNPRDKLAIRRRRRRRSRRRRRRRRRRMVIPRDIARNAGDEAKYGESQR